MKDFSIQPIVYDDNGEALPEFTQAETHRLIMQFNNTKVNYSTGKTVIDLFEKQAEESPSAVAVAFEDIQLTYKELNELSNQLAYYLRSKGVKEETLVPICIERSLQMIVGILGILKAGGAYVPIDPEYPKERILHMLEETKAIIAISNEENELKLQILTGLAIIQLDSTFSIIKHQPAVNLRIPIEPYHLAYVIFTSGSTGRPKGVMIEHRGLVNLALSQAEGFRLRPGMKTLQFASFGFDASCSEIFTTLLSGGSLALPQKKDLLSAEEFEKLINKHKVEVTTLPPSYQYVIKDSLGTIKTIISAGEPLNESIGKYLQSKGIRLLNAYGPTENTVCVSMSDDPIKENHVIVIGKPISNVQVFILDSTGNLCPVGVTGEIFVGGVQVARGYLNRPELTAESFIANPFVKDKTARMYKTGDLGRWLPDGNIEFLGRIDEQVKIRGYRIELGEIESVLQQCELVKQAVVLARKDKEGNNRLVAYIVPEKLFDRNAIITFLRTKLPEYMIPAILVRLENFPITPNGKIDKKVLPEPDINHLATDQYVPPGTETEKILVNIWQEELHMDRVGIYDNFFELGGNSIISIQIISKTRRLGYDLEPRDLFNHQNIEKLCSALTERKDKSHLSGTNGQGKCLVPIQANGKNIPFFTIHDPWIYTKLAHYLSKNQPFYCADGSLFTKVEDIAFEYIKEIKTVRPTGPYYLGGYCDHGIIALEVAHQLEACGEKVAALILFESYFSGTAKRMHYQIKKYSGKVILFRGSSRKFWKRDDPLMGWSNYFIGQVETCAIKGRLLGIFKEPGVIQLAENLRELLGKDYKYL